MPSTNYSLSMRSTIWISHFKRLLDSKERTRLQQLSLSNQTIKNVYTLNYLGCNVSFDSCQNIKYKTHRFMHMCGKIQGTFRNKTWKQIKIYWMMVMSILLYSSEILVIMMKNRSLIQAYKMRFLRSIMSITRVYRIQFCN